MLGYEDHGVFSGHLTFEYGDHAGQGFGGYALSGKNPKDSYYKNQYCAMFIEGILQTVGVKKWEDLVGKYVRVEAEFEKIHRIRNIIEDKWFDPEMLYKQTSKAELEEDLSGMEVTVTLKGKTYKAKIL